MTSLNTVPYDDTALHQTPSARARLALLGAGNELRSLSAQAYDDPSLTARPDHQRAFGVAADRMLGLLAKLDASGLLAGQDGG